MHPTRRHRYALAALAAIGCAACSQQVDIATTQCDLNRGPCTFTLDNGESGRIALSPRPLPLMKPIAIGIEAPVRTARLDFQGTTMDMGFNQATLRRDDQGRLSGSALLPVCATGAMRWRVDLYLDDSPTATARFEFDTGR
ncbi:MAG TPA: hypothetical protein VIS73_07195 [Rhodocyclaceae bacterium]